MERPLLVCRIGPNTPNLWAALFQIWSIQCDQVSHVTRVTPRQRAVDPVDWFPKELYWSGLADVPTDLCERASQFSSRCWWLSSILSSTILGHCSVSRQLTSSTSWHDMAVAAVSSVLRANSTWWDGVGTSSTCRLNHASPHATASHCEMVCIVLSLPLSRFKIFYSAPYLQKLRFSVLPFIL